MPITVQEAALLGGALASLIFICITSTRRIRDLQQEVNRVNAVRRDLVWWKTGHIPDYGDYALVSLDKGKHWYRATREDDEVIIDRPADPELLELIEIEDARRDAMKALGDYVRQYGPIGAHDTAGIQHLRDAGFGVTVTQGEFTKDSSPEPKDPRT